MERSKRDIIRIETFLNTISYVAFEHGGAWVTFLHLN